MAELAGLPDDGPTTLEAVKLQLNIAADDDRDNARLTAIVAAVNVQIRRWRVAEAAVGEASWPADIVQGASQLAARLHRRKNSPAGVESFGTQGAAYVQRTDPDIAQLLQLGPYSPPTVG